MRVDGENSRPGGPLIAVVVMPLRVFLELKRSSVQLGNLEAVADVISS